MDVIIAAPPAISPAQAAIEIAMHLDQREWHAEDLDVVADICRRAGLIIDPPVEPMAPDWELWVHGRCDCCDRRINIEAIGLVPYDPHSELEVYRDGTDELYNMVYICGVCVGIDPDPAELPDAMVIEFPKRDA